MKAQELRIGNWIKEDLTGLQHQANIYSISCCIQSSNQKGRYAPIELTEEWLLKFGFENRQWKWNDGTTSSDLFISKDDLWCLHNFEGDWNFFMLEKHDTSHWITAKVNAVHQLQNLYFALTGSELELKSLPEPTIK